MNKAIELTYIMESMRGWQELESEMDAIIASEKRDCERMRNCIQRRDEARDKIRRLQQTLEKHYQPEEYA